MQFIYSMKNICKSDLKFNYKIERCQLKTIHYNTNILHTNAITKLKEISFTDDHTILKSIYTSHNNNSSSKNNYNEAEKKLSNKQKKRLQKEKEAKIREEQNKVNGTLEYFTEYNGNFIILVNDPCNNNLIIYKTDMELNIINVSVIDFDKNDDYYNKTPHYAQNIKKQDNYIILLAKRFYKVNLDTLEVTFSNEEYFGMFNDGGNHYHTFTIDKKNNCIYLPKQDYRIFCIHVVDVDKLNKITTINFCDNTNDFIEDPAMGIWCVVQNDKLIVNMQYDFGHGFTVFLIIDIGNKPNFDTFIFKEYSPFIDNGYHIYNNYIYIDKSTLVYDINNHNFLKIDNSNLNLINSSDFRTKDKVLFSEIYKNYYIFIIDKKILIVDLDKHPLLQNVDYELTLNNNISIKSIICIYNTVINIIDIENKLFSCYSLELLEKE